MEWKIKDIGEITDLETTASGGQFNRYKVVRFTVNGTPHSIKISMRDFDAGRTNKIVEAEAQKIIEAYGSK